MNSKGETKKYTLPYDQWMGVDEGDVLNVIVHAFGNIEIIDQNGNAMQAE